MARRRHCHGKYTIATTTIEHIEKSPEEEADSHRQLGFHMLWRAITA